MSGIQEMLVIPGVVGAKAWFCDGFWNRCEGRATRICWMCNVTIARRIYSQAEITLHLRVLQDERPNKAGGSFPPEELFPFLNDMY